MCLRVIYKKKHDFFASLKSSKEGVGSGVGSGPGSICQMYGSPDRNPPQNHRSPTLIKYKTFSNFSTGRRLPLKLLHERRKRNRKERARTRPWTLFLRDSSPTTHLRRAALPKSRPVPPLANPPIKGRCLNLLEKHQCSRSKIWCFHGSLTLFSENLVKNCG
jgi:hypothetical protein